MRAIFERDFLFEASRPRALVLRTVLAATVATAVCAILYADDEAIRTNPDAAGAEIFHWGAGALVLLLALLTPPIVVGSILEERENQTLPILLATPVGPFSFAAAKLLSRWAVAMLLAVAALPCIALATMYGGVSGIQIAGLVATCLAVSLEMAAWSLWVSSVSRRLATAAVLSFLVPLMRWVLVGFLLGWLAGSRGPWPAAVASATCPLGPFLRMEGLGGTPTGWTPILGPAWCWTLLVVQPWWAYLAFSALLACAAVAAAGARLKREAEPPGGFHARTRTRRRWFRGSPGRGNPVTWKEMRLLNTAGSRPLYYGLMAAMLLIFILGIHEVQGDQGILVIEAAMVTLLSLAAAVSGAAAMGHERAGGGYDLLRATLLTPAQIARGKVAGVGLGLLFLATVPVGTAVIGVLCGSVSPRVFLGILLVVVVLPGFWATLGMVFEVQARRTRGAVVRATGLFALLLLGFPLAGMLVLISARREETAALFLAMASPPATVWGFLDSLRKESGGWGGIDSAEEMGSIWMVILAILGAGLLGMLPRLLARRMEKEREEG